MGKLRWSLVALAACVAPSAAMSQEAKSPSVLPVDTKILEERVEVNDKGLATDTVHYQLRANNTAAAQQIGQQPISYSEALTDLDIVDAFTLKADGRKLPVSPSAIYAQMPQGDAQAAMFDDLRQKVIVFPDVEAGDSIDVTFRRRDKEGIMPGQFMFDREFSRQLSLDIADITIVAPKSYPLFLETHEIAFDRRDSGNQTVYHWHFAQPVPLPGVESAPSVVDHSPRLLVTSFSSYDAFAGAFERLVEPELAVTPAIQALADQITQGVSDRRAKAEKIYEWVSRHIRYVGVEIGAGRVVPHTPDAVLTNGYGDCKDHVALFSSLLKAEGIASEMVLINGGLVYSLPSTAIMGDLDHVLTWLPEFGLYADTTAGVAPFGSLPFQEYGKPIVHATTAGNALRQLPVLGPGLATVRTRTVSHVDKTGKVEGTSTITATGPFSTLLRQIALGIEAAGTDAAAGALLKKGNVQGTATFNLDSPPEDLAPSYSLSSRWSFGPYPEIIQGRRFAMPQGLGVLGAPGDLLMGPLGNTKSGTSEPIPCYSGHTEEDVFVDAPPGYQFLQSPLDATVKTAHIAFTTHWTLSGTTLHLHRDFTSRIDTPLCTGAVRTEAVNALLAIRQTYFYGAAIAPANGTPVASAEAVRVADETAQLGTSETQVGAQVRTAELPHTNLVASLLAPHEAAYAPAPVPRESVDQQPGTASPDSSLPAAIGTHAMLTFYEERGLARNAHGRFDDAASDFTHALALASTDAEVSRLRSERASSYWFARDWRPALSDFAEAVKRNPSNADALEGLGRSEMFAGRSAQAVVSLTKAVQLRPDDPVAKLWLFVAQSRAGENARSTLIESTRGLASPATGWAGQMLEAYRGDGADPAAARNAHATGQATDVCPQEFFLGELSLAKGLDDEARKHFLASRSGGATGQVEYVAAGIELGRMK